MSFVPPQFSKFGKSVKDLFSKKYDFQNEVATKHKASKGVTVEAGGVSKGGAITGTSKINYKNTAFGSVDVQLKTNDNDKNQTVKVTLNKLVNNVEVIVSGDARPAAKVDASYAADFFAVNAVVDSDGKKTGVVTSASIGHDGLSVGATVACDPVKGSVKDYNVAAQYAQPDFTVTLQTAKSGEEIAASYFQKLSSFTSVGSLFKHNPENDMKILSVGVVHQFDRGTSLKTKVDSTGALAASVEHRIKNGPLLCAASSFNLQAKEPFTAQSCGVSVKFGDY